MALQVRGMSNNQEGQELLEGSGASWAIRVMLMMGRGEEGRSWLTGTLGTICYIIMVFESQALSVSDPDCQEW